VFVYPNKFKRGISCFHKPERSYGVGSDDYLLLPPF